MQQTTVKYVPVINALKCQNIPHAQNYTICIYGRKYTNIPATYEVATISVHIMLMTMQDDNADNAATQ